MSNFKTPDDSPEDSQESQSQEDIDDSDEDESDDGQEPARDMASPSPVPEKPPPPPKKRSTSTPLAAQVGRKRKSENSVVSDRILTYLERRSSQQQPESTPSPAEVLFFI